MTTTLVRGNEQIREESITEPLLDAMNLPSQGYHLSYNLASGRFEWLPPAFTGSLFLHEEDADVTGYEQLLADPADAVETIDTAVVNNASGEVVIDEYITYPTTGIGQAVIGGGTWHFVTFASVDNTLGVSEIVIRVYKRSSLGVETELFNLTTGEINGATATEYTVDIVEPDIIIDPTDRLVVKYFGKTTSVPNRTISLYYEGTLHYSHVHTPTVISQISLGHMIQDEGVLLTQRGYLNFVGAGVAVTDDSVNNATIVTITQSGGGSAHVIQDEGTPLTQRANLNFVGSGITVTDDAGNDATVVTISGGGVTDHGALTGLDDDDHSQYALLAGRGGAPAVTDAEFGYLAGADSNIQDQLDAISGSVDNVSDMIIGISGIIPARAGHILEDEGTPLTQRTYLNFVGSSVQVTDDSGNDATVVTITTSGGGSGGHTIYDDGVSFTQRTGLNFVGSGVYVTDDSGNDWTTVTIPSLVVTSGASTVIYNKWDVDAPPASPNAADDEFNDATVSGVWTEYDPGNTTTVSEASSWLKLEQTSHANQGWAGIYKAIPAGDFTIVTKVQLRSVRANYFYAGITLFQDAADANADLYNFVLMYDGGGFKIQINTVTAYNGTLTEAQGAGDVAYAPSFVYLRIRRTTTTYGFDFSHDGISWHRMRSNTVPFTPTHFGLGINNSGTTVTSQAYFDFWRYTASDVGIDAILSGQSVPQGATNSTNVYYTTNNTYEGGLGNGTEGTLPIWSVSGISLADSIITQSGNYLNLGSNLQVHSSSEYMKFGNQPIDSNVYFHVLHSGYTVPYTFLVQATNQNVSNGASIIGAQFAVTDTTVLGTTRYTVGNRNNVLITSNSDNPGYTRGYDSSVYHAGNGTQEYVYGSVIDVGTYNNGNDSTGAISNLFGLYIAPFRKTTNSEIYTAYGIYIGAVQGDEAYGIYQVGATELNYFAGNTGIGVAPATNTALKISADVGDYSIWIDSNTSSYEIVLNGGGNILWNGGHGYLLASSGYNLHFGANGTDDIARLNSAGFHVGTSVSYWLSTAPARNSPNDVLIFLAGLSGVTNGFTVAWDETNDRMSYSFPDGRVHIPVNTYSNKALLNVGYGGDIWSSNGWRRAIEIPDSAMVKWTGSTYHYGIGFSSGNLYFATSNDDTAGTAIDYYAIILDSLGKVSTANDLYVGGNCSAASFTDRTPYPKDKQTAYDAIKSVKAKAGKEDELDHDALHPYLKDTQTITKHKPSQEDGKIADTEEVVETGRNLSATVSALTAVIQDLIDRIDKLENR